MRVLRMATVEPQIITVEEYEEIERGLIARHMMGDTRPGDSILARLLLDNRALYLEAKKVNAALDKPA